MQTTFWIIDTKNQQLRAKRLEICINNKNEEYRIYQRKNAVFQIVCIKNDNCTKNIFELGLGHLRTKIVQYNRSLLQ